MVTGVVLVFFVSLHSATGDWWPRAIPTSVQYQGRDFSCAGGHAQLSDADLRGLVARGLTAGGGVIYAPPGSALPTGIAVGDGSTIRSCSLSGAP